jgi:signal transduction histidine kinase
MGSRRGSTPEVFPLIASGTLVAALIAFNLFLGLGYDARPRPFLASDIALGTCFSLAGLAAWRLRPRSRTGLWMLIMGVVILTENPNGFALPRRLPGYDLIQFFCGVLYWLQFAVAAQLMLSYPSGRLRRGSPERRLIVVIFVHAIAGGAIVQALQVAGVDSPGFPRVRILVMVAWVVLAAAAAGLLIRRIVRSTPRQRRKDGFGLAAGGLAVVVFAAIFIALLVIYGATPNLASSAELHAGLAWTAIVAVPIMFFVGLLRERLAFAAVADLIGKFKDVGAERIESALGEALHEPTLRVTFPVPDGLLDVQGRRYEVPVDGSRAVTPLGEPPVAVLVHDPALLSDRELLDTAATAARLALDNARLYAQVRAQLDEVRASRQRIAAAADTERRRLERDLHDGAQQRLLGVGFTMSTLRTRLVSPADRELVRELEQELRAAVAELRDFAHGIRPAILTDQGLVPALSGLARRSAVRVSLDLRVRDRLDPVVESTAYYVVCEALQNVAKHTEDALACVLAVHEDHRLIIEVSDDGPGGASVQAGTGLRGLTDRVSAVGGCLQVRSPPGGGTTVRAEMPCG